MRTGTRSPLDLDGQGESGYGRPASPPAITDRFFAPAGADHHLVTTQESAKSRHASPYSGPCIRGMPSSVAQHNGHKPLGCVRSTAAVYHIHRTCRPPRARQVKGARDNVNTVQCAAALREVEQSPATGCGIPDRRREGRRCRMNHCGKQPAAPRQCDCPPSHTSA